MADLPFICTLSFRGDTNVGMFQRLNDEKVERMCMYFAGHACGSSYLLLFVRDSLKVELIIVVIVVLIAAIVHVPRYWCLCGC